MSRMLLASNNAHKLTEIIRVIEAPQGAVLRPSDVSRASGQEPPDPVEDGADYRANATIKAREFSGWADLPAMADDSGLEIDALDGRPGLYSARYAGPDATFEDNCSKVLAELEGVPPEKRTARFICVLVLCQGDEVLFEAEGICPGRIALAPSGKHGFGYDPIFIPDPHEVTFATMSEDQKNSLSHRGLALQTIRKAVADGSFPLELMAS